MASFEQPSPDPEAPGKLGLFRHLRLGLSSSYYRMAEVFGLKRLQDFMLASRSLPESSSPLWLLGSKYQNAEDSSQALEQEVWNAIMSDLFSRIWMTYRRNFPPIQGPEGLTSDVGWGCTLRSGQMMLAQALLHHLVGRQWRHPLESVCPAEVAQILHWFMDDPAPQHAFSLHRLCAAGRGRGITPGEWLGPWTLCHALDTLVNAVQPGGLCIHVAASTGGGAPVLYASRVVDKLISQSSEEARPPDRGLLLLVPLVLGIGKINPRYIPQLQEVLQWPQSTGIVGGRPSSSLYFIGCQDANVLFLDPHEVQQAVASESDLGSYFCNQLRCMPLANIDPSLAIGFYCRNTEEFADLCKRLTQLEQASGGAPLLCISEGEAEPAWAGDDVLDGSTPSIGSGCGSDTSNSKKGEEWEFL